MALSDRDIFRLYEKLFTLLYRTVNWLPKRAAPITSAVRFACDRSRSQKTTSVFKSIPRDGCGSSFELQNALPAAEETATTVVENSSIVENHDN
jgi:hypothetical protein